MKKIISGIVYYLVIIFFIFSIHVFAANGNWKIANFYSVIAGVLVVLAGCILGIIHEKAKKKNLLVLLVLGVVFLVLAIVNININGTEFAQAYIETGSGAFYTLFSKGITMEKFPFSFIWIDYFTWNIFSLIYMGLFFISYFLVQWKKTLFTNK